MSKISNLILISVFTWVLTSCKTVAPSETLSTMEIQNIQGHKVDTKFLVVEFSFYGCPPCTALAKAQDSGELREWGQGKVHGNCTFKKILPLYDQEAWSKLYPNLVEKTEYVQVETARQLFQPYAGLESQTTFPAMAIYNKEGLVAKLPADGKGLTVKTWLELVEKTCK